MFALIVVLGAFIADTSPAAVVTLRGVISFNVRPSSI